MTDTSGNYIDGEWTDAASGETFTTTDPAAPGEEVGRYQQSGREDARAAVEAAAVAAEE